MGHYTYYCIPTQARSIEKSKNLIKLRFSCSVPSNLVGLHCENVIDNNNEFLRVVNSEDLKSYFVTPFQDQKTYMWYANANRMCLPSKNITDYRYYQNTLHILADFCKDQMSIDTAQILISTLFAEVINCE